MKILKNNVYWILGILICLIVVSVIILQVGQEQTEETGPITPDTATSPSTVELANLNWYDSPEEVIGSVLNALRNTPQPDSASLHAVLGFAYQRLGDYKTAWVHLKKGQSLTEQSLACCPSPAEGTPNVEDPEHYDYSAHIAAIESGHPLVQRQRIARSSHDNAAAFEELKGFLMWAGAIMRDTPITTNNFLAKELESHLLGKKTMFHPERITRAFELMERHKQRKGMRLLQQSDPPLAREVIRLLNKKQNKG